MSQINTNGINVNYPVPGKNNSSQGFRDNFNQIKTNINVAATEITDLQNKVIVKAALENSVLNNDMGNTLISNASTSGWRATTYDLGNALDGTVLINVNKADVHYGTINSNVALQFRSWSPTGTESNVTVRLAVANTDATISLPSQCVSSNNNFGVTLLENYSNVANVTTLSVPAGTEVIELNFSTLDCGNTITVTPVNRPFQSTQIINRDPPPTGVPGDMKGAVAVGSNYLYVCTGAFDSSVHPKEVLNTYASGNILTLENTDSLVVNAPIIFTGSSANISGTNLVADKVYYIKTVVSGNITISDTRPTASAPEVAIGTKANANITSTTYVGANIWKRVDINSW